MTDKEVRDMQKGFTMIELMIVMSLVAILTAAGIFTSKNVMPSWRTKQAASDFADRTREARMLAILLDRETKVEIIDYDSSTGSGSEGTTAYGHYQVSVGDAAADSTFFDVLPFEDTSGTDVGKGEGDFDFGYGGRHELRSVSLAEPSTDEIIFDPRGWLTNSATDFTHSESGAVEYVFVNKRRVEDSWSVLVFRSGMVRMEHNGGREFSSNSGGTEQYTTQ
ncbi:MAG TPA: type II secretion system protein [Myxococcota bacterium]|nr:type II secretion system protein [Myxococcota bacterium]